MGENPGSNDRYFEALDFIINVLKEHEQSLDKSVHELATVTEQIGDIETLNGKMEMVEEKLNNLQKELANLIGYFSHVPKETYSAGLNKQESQAQVEPAASPAVIQGMPSMILHCKQWGDFQGLAMYAQMLTFRIKEDEKVLQADAIKGKQIVMFTGDLPDFSLILKTWLSKQLETPEKNIVEGFLEKAK